MTTTNFDVQRPVYQAPSAKVKQISVRRPLLATSDPNYSCSYSEDYELENL